MGLRERGPNFGLVDFAEDFRQEKGLDGDGLLQWMRVYLIQEFPRGAVFDS